MSVLYKKYFLTFLLHDALRKNIKATGNWKTSIITLLDNGPPQIEFSRDYKKIILEIIYTLMFIIAKMADNIDFYSHYSYEINAKCIRFNYFRTVKLNRILMFSGLVTIIKNDNFIVI